MSDIRASKTFGKVVWKLDPELAMTVAYLISQSIPGHPAVAKLRAASHELNPPLTRG